jgi:hypothetical protein
MCCFENEEETVRKDMKAIERIVAIDPKGFYNMLDNIPIRAAIPITIMLIAAGALGASKGKLVQYMTSASVSGDSSRVQGCAGITVS